MKKGLLIAVFLVGNIAFSQSQSKMEKISELIKVTGSVRNTEQVREKLFEVYEQQFPQLSKEFWQTAKSKFDITKLYQEKLIPIFDKYYTEEELDAAITFYKSPLGSSFVSKQPQITEASMEIGSQWGREVAESLHDLIMKEMIRNEKNNVKMPPPPPPPAR